MSDYKVKLVRASSITTSGGYTTWNQLDNTTAVVPGEVIATGYKNGRTQEAVVFEVTPEFSEGRTVDYKNLDPVHAPGAIYMYATTRARTFSISGKFISRSVNEATKNLTYMQYLRSWAMPVFGTVSANAPVGENILGAPPAILLLSAYSSGPLSTTDTQTTVPGPNGTLLPALGNNIYQVPVIMTNLDIPYPSDVDYIPTVNKIPVPTVVTVTINLTEAHSPNAYGAFDLQAYKTGNLDNF